LPDLAGYRLGLPGTHNQRNAAAVAVCATALGLRPDQIQGGFDTFAGVKRRMEVRGEARGVTVLDDFAHHPTALAETLRAIREGYPARRVWALFEPRSNTTRRNVFQRELAESLALADAVYVTRVDRLQEIPAAQRLDPLALVAAVRQQGRPAEYLPDAEAILDSLLPQLRSGDVVAVFSNGQFDNIHDKLLARLTAQ
jgi:UDP-N-acetylmuramate: L-alanyl-gamma-D-glutamyl-meso-diaminopimelate ligase